MVKFATLQFIFQPDPLIRRVGAAGTLISNSKAMFCGGYDDSNLVKNECHILHQNGSWSLTSAMVKRRSYLALSKLEQGFLVTGGSPNADSIEFFDGQKWELSDIRIPVGLYGHCMASLYPKLESTLMLQLC